MPNNQNISVISKNIDIALIHNELRNPQVDDLWKSFGPIFNAFIHTETLLLVGSFSDGTLDENAFRNSTEITDYHKELFPETFKWLSNNFEDVQRASFIKLFPRHRVKKHKDVGEYFEKIQRFHLCIKGEYIYYVGEDSLHVKPGTLFTFDNNVIHGAQNMKNINRITLVFDVLKE